MTKFKDIPSEFINEISFILGSIEMCNDEHVMPILARHGYEIEDGSFLGIEPEDDEALAIDIYETLFRGEE